MISMLSANPRLWAKGVAIGLAAGFFGGLVGQGGGVVAVPAMTAFAGLTQHQAHGTSLIMVATTGLAGALSYYNNPPDAATPSPSASSAPSASSPASPSSSAASPSVFATAGEGEGGEKEGEGVGEEGKSLEHKKTKTDKIPGLDFGAALLMCMGASLFARLGALYTAQLTGKALKKVLGTFMVASSLMVTFKAAYSHYTKQHTTPSALQAPVSLSLPQEDSSSSTPENAPTINAPSEQAAPSPARQLSPAAEAFVNRWHIYLATGCTTGFASGMLVPVSLFD